MNDSKLIVFEADYRFSNFLSCKNVVIEYVSSFCKLFRSIGSCVDHYHSLRKDIKFCLYSTKLLGVLSFSENVKKTFRSVRNIIHSKTVQERIKYIFNLVLGVDKILGTTITVIKMIKTVERVNNILKYWIPYYDIVNLPIDAVKILLKIKTVYHYSKLRSDLLALEKNISYENKNLILLKMLDRLTFEKIDSLQNKLYVNKQINLSNQVSEYKKVLSFHIQNEKTVDDINVFMKNLSSRIIVKCNSDGIILISNIFNFVVKIVIFSFTVSTPVGLIFSIVMSASSLLLKSVKDIAFYRCGRNYFL